MAEENKKRRHLIMSGLILTYGIDMSLIYLELVTGRYIAFGILMWIIIVDAALVLALLLIVELKDTYDLSLAKLHGFTSGLTLAVMVFRLLEVFIK